MAAETWQAASPEFSLSSIYAPIFPPSVADDSDGGSAGSAALMVPESPARPQTAFARFVARHLELFHALQELFLLLLLGVSTNAVAFLIDRSIDGLTQWRARAAQEAGAVLSSYLLWTGMSLAMCGLSAAVVHLVAPSAAGSGIPQMKCVLAGVKFSQVRDYLSMRTMLAKSVSMVLAFGGGLSIGKEGPFVHISSCVAMALIRLPLFRRIGQSDHLRNQVLAAGCAAGVASTFGAPVGGVLFSIEVTCTYYSVSHLWKAMFTAVCGALVFRVAERTTGSKAFSITDFGDMSELLYNGEIFAFGFLGAFCGLLGAAFVHATASLVRLVRTLRKRLAEELDAPAKPAAAAAAANNGGRAKKSWLRSRLTTQHVAAALLSRYGYTLVVAFTSAMLTFPFGFFRSSPQEVTNELFGSAPFDFTARWSNPSLVLNLTIFIVCKFVFTTIAVGCPISCGVFTPVFLVGAATGRCFGEILNDLTPSSHVITAGGYAVVGAAAMAAGVTRTVSTSVIVFELTGQLSHMLPVLVAVLAACGVGNALNLSIYDTMMKLNNLQYLQPLPPHEAAGRTAADVMDAQVVAVSSRCTHLDLYLLLKQVRLPEFAVVDTSDGLVLLGEVTRATLERLVERQLHNPRRAGAGEFTPGSVLGALKSWQQRQRWLPQKEHLGTLHRHLETLRSPVALPALLDRLKRRGSGEVHRLHDETSDDQRYRTPAPGTAEEAAPAPEAVVVGGDGAAAAAEGSGAATPAEGSFRSPTPNTPPPELEELCAGLSQAEISLLLLPVDFGVDSAAGPRGFSVINLSPAVVLSSTPLQTVHQLFELMGHEHVYVTFAGQLLGVIRRSQLIGDEGE